MIGDILVQNIKETARDYDISLKELAEKIGLSEQGLHSMFRKKSFKLEILEQIADFLQVSVSDLFDEGDRDVYFDLVSDIENAKLLIRKMALKGKGVVDLYFNEDNNRINLDFAELKEKVSLSYYKDYLVELYHLYVEKNSL